MLETPLGLDKAIGVLATLNPVHIDVAEVNGRVFLHNVTIGLMPRIALVREQIRGKPGISPKAEFGRYFLERLSLAKRLAIEVDQADGPVRIYRAQAVVIANNSFDEGFGRVLSRQRIDQGTLAIYVVKRLRLGDIVRLTTEMVVGRWLHDDALIIDSARAVTVRLKQRDVLVTIDGEVERLPVPLRFKLRLSVLSVLAPAPLNEVVEIEPDGAPRSK